MRAMLLHGPGQRLTLEHIDRPTPGPGQVLVEVEACAVCRTDLHLLDGELPDIPYPVVPGHQIVGRVEALGTSVHDWQIGERVGAAWLRRACGRCRFCAHDAENEKHICSQRNLNPIGSARNPAQPDNFYQTEGQGCPRKKFSNSREL